jgi:hypothetical protein
VIDEMTRDVVVATPAPETLKTVVVATPVDEEAIAKSGVATAPLCEPIESFAHGDVVPTPTLPDETILILSIPVPVSKIRLAADPDLNVAFVAELIAPDVKSDDAHPAVA